MLVSVFGQGFAPTASATVNNIAAPILFASSTQINLQIPDNTSAGPAYVGINNNGSVAGTFINITPTAPGIFATLTTAKPGDTLSLFLTGAGDPDGNATIAISVAGQFVQESYIGIPPGLIGTTQVNFTVPLNTPLGPQPVVALVGGINSPPITLTLRR